MTEERSFSSKSDKPSTNSININIINKWEDFTNLKFKWNALLSQSDLNRVYLTHEWFSAWWQSFGKDMKLSALLAFDNKDLIGIAPLIKKKTYFRGWPVTSIEFMSNNDSPACGFIYKRGYDNIATLFINYLLGSLKNWDIIFLKNIANNKNILHTIESSLKHYCYKYITRPGLRSPYLIINENWDNYFKTLSSKRRKTIRNVTNRIKKLGEIKVKKIEYLTSLTELEEITQKGWKFKEGKSFLNKKERRSFFKNLSDIASKNGWLSVWMLYNSKSPIAYEYHLKYNNSSIALLSEFNEDFKKYSPGAYLDYMIVKSYFNNGLEEYDMGGSQDDYKKKWTNNTRDYSTLIVFNKNLSGFLCYFLEQFIIDNLRKIRNVFIYHNK